MGRNGSTILILRCTYAFFFTHLVMYKGCYSCKFSNIERNSDITIGDFWGVEDVFPELNPGKGVSLILTNTDKGQRILNRIQQSLAKEEVLLECKNDDYRKYQHNLNSPTEMPEMYDQFWRDYKDKGFEYILKEYKVTDFMTYARYCKHKVSGILKGNQSN